jgi:hypothetical protein
MKKKTGLLSIAGVGHGTRGLILNIRAAQPSVVIRPLYLRVPRTHTIVLDTSLQRVASMAERWNGHKDRKIR